MPKPGTYDLTNAISEYEDGMLDSDEITELFQYLIDTGKIFVLQGSYQRTAQNLIDAGLCIVR